jgi:Mg2+-importing ATPase
MEALKVIVKRPSAIQDMGALDVLCTDKTGTLTEARIRLERHVDAAGQDNPQVLALAYLNSCCGKPPLSAARDCALRLQGRRQVR